MTRDATVVSARRCPKCQMATDDLLCPNDSTVTLIRGLPWVDPSTIRQGQVIADRYRVETKLGQGGFGAVFAARHLSTGQDVAIKVLNAGAEEDELILLRFFQEAQVTAGLKHPNTVRVFDFGQDDQGVIFLTMERLIGKTLRHELAERLTSGMVMPEHDAVRIAIDILRSLAEAHAAGLVHRDLKPDNIMLHVVPGDDVPTVKVLDFGIAKLHNSTLTGARQVPCTPEFASPEQATGRPIDGRADLYSLGICLYYMLSGKLPFRGSTPIETLKLQVTSIAPDLRAVGQCSEVVIKIIERAMCKNADDRYADATAMRRALQAAIGASTPFQRPSIDEDAIPTAAAQEGLVSTLPPDGGVYVRPSDPIVPGGGDDRTYVRPSNPGLTPAAGHDRTFVRPSNPGLTPAGGHDRTFVRPSNPGLTPAGGHDATLIRPSNPAGHAEQAEGPTYDPNNDPTLIPGADPTAIRPPAFMAVPLSAPMMQAPPRRGPLVALFFGGVVLIAGLVYALFLSNSRDVVNVEAPAPTQPGLRAVPSATPSPPPSTPAVVNPRPPPAVPAPEPAKPRDKTPKPAPPKARPDDSVLDVEI